MSRLIAPGIQEIFHINSSKIWTDIELAAEAGIAPTLLHSELDGNVRFYDEPELNESNSTEDGQLSSTTSITFKTDADALPSNSICLVIHTNDDNWYVIGNHERGAKVSYERSKGTTQTANLYTYTVEHTSSHSLVRIEIIE